ncbi:MAG: hypothetical protein IPL31_02070 [Saprospiraceae bacterium]|nr:hypothetical protein [Saprospiraceae bacterium]
MMATNGFGIDAAPPIAWHPKVKNNFYLPKKLKENHKDVGGVECIACYRSCSSYVRWLALSFAFVWVGCVAAKENVSENVGDLYVILL